MTQMLSTSINYSPQRNTTGINSIQKLIHGSELSIQTPSKQSHGLFILPDKHVVTLKSNLMEPGLQELTDITRGTDTQASKTHTGLSNSTVTNENR